MPLIEPKEFSVKTLKGDTRTYIISRLPASVGRKIVTQYPVTATPKVGNYGDNEALMQLLLSYVAVKVEGRMDPMQLETMALIDNHIPDYETLMHVEFAMMDYNTSFFASGKASTFFEGLAAKVQALITKTLTDFSQR